MTKQKIAFLGPTGSYTELALREFIADSAEKSAALSIADVFELVAGKQVLAGFVPVENLIQGPVTETLDLLFEHRQSIKILASHSMQIEHVLATLEKNISIEKIKKVISHKQALQQCSVFLNKQLGSAEQESVSSTSAAIEKIKTENLKDAAVIAAKQSANEQGLHILQDKIANTNNNKTRFILIAHKDKEQELANLIKEDTSEMPVTSVVLNPGKDKKGLLFEILKIISIKNEINLLSIHSRPDRTGGFVFFFDLEGHRNDKKITECIKNLKTYCQENTSDQAEIVTFGSYKRRPFTELAFKSVGIIGGNGRMGSWFAKILGQSGLEVHICDKDSGISIEKLCEVSDVILISTPMQVTLSIAQELKKYLSREKLGNKLKDKLVVENCSIKQSILPRLCNELDKDIEVLGVHTMFAADIESLEGENVIICKTERSTQKAQCFEDILYKHGANICHASSAEHDKILSFNQSLMHFSLIALAEVLREEIGDKRAEQEFSTPNSRSIMQAMKRVLAQSDELLIDMQTLNEDAKVLRQAFLERLKRLVAELEQDPQAFLRSAQESRRYFDL